MLRTCLHVSSFLSLRCNQTLLRYPARILSYRATSPLFPSSLTLLRRPFHISHLSSSSVHLEPPPLSKPSVAADTLLSHDIHSSSSAWESISDSVHPLVLNVLKGFQFRHMTNVQSQSIPPSLKGRNIVASDKTGTGKTFAYVIPVVSRVLDELDTNRDHDTKTSSKSGPLAIILTPTRELAEQVHINLQLFVRGLPNVRTLAVYGGVGEASQTAALQGRQRGRPAPGQQHGTTPHILVATPGRLLHLVTSDAVTLSGVRMLVIDECDKMFDMGMFPDIKQLFKNMPKPAKQISDLQQQDMQVLMFSATLPKDMIALIPRFAPHGVMVNLNKSLQPASTISQSFFLVANRRKHALLMYLLRRKGSLKGKKVLVFTRTQQRAERLVESLLKDNISADVIHKDKSIAQRRSVVEAFREGKVSVCVATDVMARGMDIEGIEAVVNYDVPSKTEDYIHRIGRTGRQGANGIAFTFVSSDPQVIIVGNQTTEINEEHYIKSLSAQLAEPVFFRKVPGPWKDEAKSSDKDEKGDHAQQAVAGILVRRGVLQPDRKGHLRPTLISPNLDKRKSSHWPQKPHFATDGLKGLVLNKAGVVEELPPLRNFEEGRFEEVISRFEKKRAVKRGIALPKKKEQIWRRKKQSI